MADVTRMKVTKRFGLFFNSFLLIYISSFGKVFLCTSSGLYCLQILPSGTAWIPSLVQTITDAVLSGSKGILVDQKLIEGPNPNNRGKVLIPFILAFQVNSQTEVHFVH